MENKEIARLIPRIKSKNSKKSYKMIWMNSPSFSRLLGYLLSEGRLSTTSNQIWFTNGDEELVSDYSKIIKEVFDLTPTINEYKPNCWDVIGYSFVIRIILSKFGPEIVITICSGWKKGFTT